MCEFYEFNEDNSDFELELQLIQKEIITDISYMFSEIKSLLSLSLSFFWNTIHFTDISFMFYNCSSLISLPDLSIWNTIQIKKMDHMFYGCNSLTSIPDISKWNTNNLTDISYIFYGCNKLISLPDISEWNLINVTNIKSIFAYCKSLKSLPDISKWETNNVTDISYIFYGCEELTSLPDISKWNINNVKDMSYMFYECSKITLLPDISKWDTINVNNLKSMFSYCKELISLPDISNWNITNVTDISCMFYGCCKLSSLPDINKWNTKNIIDKSDMFVECPKLKNLPKNFISNNNNLSKRNSLRQYSNLSIDDYIINENIITFEEFIYNKKLNCKGIHENSVFCQNCIPPSELIYCKQNICKNHPKEKYCNKCIPPNIILEKQTYSQVNFISFMNHEEIDNFLKPWIDNFFQVQKMAFLYGYYRIEKNFPNKITAVVETLYEPPQFGNESSFLLKEDKDKSLIDKISKGLSLECIGWIFTTLKDQKIKLKKDEVIKAAKFQQEYIFKHSSGCHISRFITCVVSPNDLGDCKYDTYMVSDICQALERDNIFDELNENDLLEIREPKNKEILPIVFIEGIETNQFYPDIFIIDIDHGFVSDKKGKNLIKTFDFPIISKYNKTTGQKMVNEYFKKYKKVDSNIKCANLNFLIYIAKNFDLETAINFAQQILDKSLDWDMVETLLNNYIE